MPETPYVVVGAVAAFALVSRRVLGSPVTLPMVSTSGCSVALPVRRGWRGGRAPAPVSGRQTQASFSSRPSVLD